MKDKILNTVVGNLIPFIQIFGMYVIFHGHLSPGGGLPEEQSLVLVLSFTE